MLFPDGSNHSMFLRQLSDPGSHSLALITQPKQPGMFAMFLLICSFYFPFVMFSISVLSSTSYLSYFVLFQNVVALDKRKVVKPAPTAVVRCTPLSRPWAPSSQRDLVWLGIWNTSAGWKGRCRQNTTCMWVFLYIFVIRVHLSYMSSPSYRLS